MSLLAQPEITQYGQRPKPTVGESTFNALRQPAYRSAYAIQSMFDWAKGEPTDQRLTDAVDLIGYQLQHPDFSTGQTVANSVAGVAGMMLDPTSLILGGVIGKGLGKGASLISNLIPDTVSALSGGYLSKSAINEALSKPISVFANNKYAKYLPKNLHEVIETEAKNAGMMTGFTLPESFLENYDKDTQRLNYGGMVESIAFNGGIGLAIPPLAWTAGVILGKAGRFLGEELKELPISEKIKKLALAREKGGITEKEEEWLRNVYENPKDYESHLNSSMKLLDKENHPVNVFSGKLEVPFMTQEEMKQFQTFAVDQMASNNSISYKNALSDFVTHSMLDRMGKMVKDNPAMLDGIKAHIDETASRIEKRVEQLAKEDVYINHTTPRSSVKNQPLSQQKLYNMMKKGNMNEREMPFIVPENIKKMFKLEGDLKQLELKSKNYQREFDKTGRSKFKKLKEKNDLKIKISESVLDRFKTKEGKIQTQAQEVKNIQRRLIGSDKLPPKYQMSTDYYRLLDLTHVYPQARALLRKIAIREQYEMQAAYNEVLKGIVNIAESGMKEIANADRVVNYFKERIEGKANIQSFEKYMSDKVESVEKTVSSIESKAKGNEQSIEQQFNDINDNPNISGASKEEFNVLYSKLNQFKTSEKALEEMIKCMMGAANVAI